MAEENENLKQGNEIDYDNQEPDGERLVALQDDAGDDIVEQEVLKRKRKGAHTPKNTPTELPGRYRRWIGDVVSMS
ncbi:hypothetical protein PHMEG_00011086 [Phytophthora megakarya]|uniref:Uncharacterized protein n=1 Tax=Phytophthora megakarya TaxID=4795 RepID=A0A225WCL9_9STRA|nr:hypothetical protein PHMEG_00011086 [Phytophthora megakarya]